MNYKLFIEIISIGMGLIFINSGVASERANQVIVGMILIAFGLSFIF